MKAWFRAISPPVVYTSIAILMYVIAVILQDVVPAFFLQEWDLLLPLKEGGLIVLGFAATVYAGYRVVGFHPLFQDEYQDWLRSSPWTFEKALPFGPVQIVLQDVIVVSILTAFSLLHETVNLLTIPASFLITYIVGIASIALILGMFRKAYLIAFGLGVVLYYRDVSLLSAGLLLGLYGVARVVIQESLRKFRDWDEEWLGERKFLKMNMKEGSREKALGWPHDLLAPFESTKTLTQTGVIAIALLCGWWTFVLIGLANEGFPAPFFITPGLYAVAIRLIMYCGQYAPPISLSGRLWTGRWIIPGYDYVLIAPVIALLIGPLLLWAASYWHWNLDLVVPVIVCLQVFFLCQAPSYKSWRLTGQHRIRAPMGAKANLVQTQ